MGISIRQASVDDSELIALIGRLTFRETFGSLFVDYENDLKAYLQQTFSVAKIRSSLSKPHNVYWIAMFDGLPVGYAKLKYPSPSDAIEYPAPAQLQKIYVLSEFIEHRLGHELLQAVMNFAGTTAAKTMWLSVLNTNDRAIRFYQRHDWVDIGKASFAIGAQTFAFVVMTKGV